jgi:restriction system protein
MTRHDPRPANDMAEFMSPDDVRRELRERTHRIDVVEDWLTPAGRPRTVPMFEAAISNDFLDQHRVIKGKDRNDVLRKAREQLGKWDELELSQRTMDSSDAQDARARAEQESLSTILAATLDVDDRLDWEAMYSRRVYPDFSFEAEPSPLPLVQRPWYTYLLPFLRRRWEAQCDALVQANKKQRAVWEARRARAWLDYEGKRAEHAHGVKRHNEQIAEAKRRYEAGDVHAVVEYLGAVFERSRYPDSLLVEHAVSFDPSSQTAIVDIDLPDLNGVTNVTGYKVVRARNQIVPTVLKPKDHAALYDFVVRQIVLRTMHEVYESDYAQNARACVVNGFVDTVDRGTGKDIRVCIISVASAREHFSTFDLSRIDPDACIKKLKGVLAGPLSEVAPVRPLLQLSRHDSRFVDSRNVLDDLGDQNLAEMEWEAFEHLVRELFSKMFSGEGAEVKVTQASRDQGVDAVAFDPNPIRGGKFVIQAKRYTKVVPVSAVRDLYGTVHNEGASRGIIVTTAHYGRDAREFAKDKPLTLIDGPHLVHLLEEHGYRVRLDVAAARRRASG